MHLTSSRFETGGNNNNTAPVSFPREYDVTRGLPDYYFRKTMWYVLTSSFLSAKTHAPYHYILVKCVPDTDTDIAVTGLRFSPVAPRSVGTERSSSLEEELIEALEADNQVTGACPTEYYV